MELHDLARITTGVAPSGHTTWDNYAVELETAELLYGLVRAAKPELVVESGTGRGVAARYICGALQANRKGSLVTFEVHVSFIEAAKEMLAGCPAEVRQGTSCGSGLEPDMVFIDCVSDLRDQEIEYWLTCDYRPLVVIHDAIRPYAFHLGEGVHVPGHDGIWIGRPKPKEI